MAIELSVRVVGLEALRRGIRDLTPAQNESIQRNVLRKLALITQRDAAQNQMKRGGKAPPIRGKLTSRTGTGRRSIRTNFGELPRQTSVGSDLKYMALHEEGGTVSIGSHTVRRHTRRVAFGRNVKPFQVGPYTRGPYSATYPKRPWLRPAVDVAVRQGPDLLRREWEGAVRGG